MKMLDRKQHLHKIELCDRFSESSFFEKMEKELTSWTEIKYEVDVILRNERRTVTSD